MRMDTRKMSVLAMLSALSFVAMLFGRVPGVVPAVGFLSYDPKDILITISGFLYGPMAAFMVTVVVAFIEMVFVSATGFFGLLMNIVSGCAFACTASFIYQKKRSLKGAVIALVAAWLFTTAVMTLWNYIIAPLYMENVTREQVAALLLPGFVPFNLLKGGLNAAMTMLLYKPVSMALKASRMMPTAERAESKGKINAGVIIASLFVIATCVLWVLVLQGRL